MCIRDRPWESLDWSPEFQFVLPLSSVDPSRNTVLLGLHSAARGAPDVDDALVAIAVYGADAAGRDDLPRRHVQDTGSSLRLDLRDDENCPTQGRKRVMVSHPCLERGSSW